MDSNVHRYVHKKCHQSRAFLTPINDGGGRGGQAAINNHTIASRGVAYVAVENTILQVNYLWPHRKRPTCRTVFIHLGSNVFLPQEKENLFRESISGMWITGVLICQTIKYIYWTTMRKIMPFSCRHMKLTFFLWINDEDWFTINFTFTLHLVSHYA